MESILADVYRDALSKLRTSIEDASLLSDAAVDIVMISHIVRTEGLLGMEEFVEDHEPSFSKWLVMLIAGGTDYDTLSEMAANEYWMRAPEGVCAMIDYMYIRGLRCIQENWNESILVEFLQTLIPPEFRSEFLEKLYAKQTAVIEKKRKYNAEQFAKVCPIFRNAEVIEKIHTLEKKICKFSNRTIQRVLRDLECDYAAVCIYAMNKDAGNKVIDNMSTRVRDLVIDEIVRFAPFNESKVLADIEKTLYIIDKLSESREIYETNDE